jgi:signal transduction histidine kinase/PAS domain-containing protein
MWPQANHSQPAPTASNPAEESLPKPDTLLHQRRSRLAWWHRWAAPPEPPGTASLAERKAYRHALLTSAILFILIVEHLLEVVTIDIFHARWLLPTRLGMVLLWSVALWLNRHNYLTSAAVLVVVAGELGLTFTVLITPGGLSVLGVSFLGFMVLVVITAVSLLPAETVFLVALFNIFFSWAVLLWMPRTADLTALLRSQARVDILIFPLALNGMAAIISYFWVRSGRRAMIQAEQATELALQEQAIAAARASQLEATFEAMADGVAVFDQRGQSLQMNPALRHILGTESILSETGGTQQAEWDTLLPATDEYGQPMAPECRPLARILRGERLTGAHVVDLLVHTSDGRRLLLNVSGAPVYSQARDIDGAVLVYRDVTERRRLQQRTQEVLEALLAMAETLVGPPADAEMSPLEEASWASQVARQLAERTRQVLGCELVSITTLDPQNDIIQPVTVVGRSPEVEQRWLASCQPCPLLSERMAPQDLAALRAGEVVVRDQFQPPDADSFSPARFVVVAPLFTGQQLIGMLWLWLPAPCQGYTPEEQALTGAVGKMAALVIECERLIREREEARANLLALAEANRRMDAFLTIASHELKTPLSSLQLHFQLAGRRLKSPLLQAPQLPPEQARQLATLQERYTWAEQPLARLTRLVDDLLDTTRIQAKRLPIRRELVDLSALVQKVVGEHQHSDPNRTFHLLLSFGKPLFCLVDTDRIEQVMTNFLSNALKYSPEAQPVEVGLQSEGQQVRFWVRDGGPGIPQAEQAHLWERFYRVPGIEVQSGSGVGLGLGLYISKTIIEQHGGQVGVESAPGQGATFWFRLPCPSSAPA